MDNLHTGHTLGDFRNISTIYISAAASGGAGWALAHPEFGSSVNPITTRGADYAQRITASPPGFENLAAALHSVCDCLIYNVT